MEVAHKMGYRFNDSTHEKESIVSLVSLMGKKEQAPRIYKLYALFDCFVNQKFKDDISRVAEIRKVLQDN